MKCFAIKDIKSEGFNTPFFQATFGLAERAFKDACQDEKSTIAKHREDFSLYYIGQFDQTSGEFIAEQPKHVCDAT